MNDSTRACVAFIIGASTKSNINSVYDYSQSKHISISGNSAHVSLNFNNNQFSGYDYDSSNHYSGNLNGKSVSIYDYETSQHYNYGL